MLRVQILLSLKKEVKRRCQLLVFDDRVTNSLPQSEHDRNWAAWDVLAVAFTDLDSDGSDDIMVLS